MSTEIIIDTEYNGYVFVGWAAGRFQTDRGEMMPYANMFVLSPVSSYESEDYQASGMKAEKKKCLSPEVWNGLEPGDRVKLFFDDKKCQRQYEIVRKRRRNFVVFRRGCG